jgi:hypothetical protein
LHNKIQPDHTDNQNRKQSYCFSCRYYTSTTREPQLFYHYHTNKYCCFCELQFAADQPSQPTPRAQQPGYPVDYTTDTLHRFSLVELGSRKTLILVLPPTANSQEQIDAAKVIASQFTERTGYTVVTVIPDSTRRL